MQNLTLPSRNQRKLSKLHLEDLSAEAKRRLKWFDWHREHGENVSLTCRHFGIARETFYRWKRRYQPAALSRLEDRSSRPKHCRQRQWTTAAVLSVQRMREEYIGWGKEKLRVLLSREGVKLSASTIGRILTYLKRTMKLREPLRRSLRRRRQWKRQYATRMPKGYAVRAPGDLVQMDTTEIKPEPGFVLKQFTTVDVVSRWSVPTIASNATASLATRALDELIDRAPFPIRAIQVDGGSEFMADFEAACQQRGIRLFELPPRSPKAQWPRRARQPHLQRRVLRLLLCLTHRPRLRRRPASLGTRLQPHPSSPGTRLRHPSRVLGQLERHPPTGGSVTDVLNQHRVLR